jgi:hypothetical protein
MARLTVGQKGQRALRLLWGFSQPRIAERMQPYGFTEQERRRGWLLLEGLTVGELRSAPSQADPKLYDSLDVWENQWFPIASASLRFRFPAVHAWLFQNLRQTEGLEVVLSVGTFVHRMEQLPSSGVEGAEEARVVLGERGLTEAVMNEARDLLNEIRTVEQEAKAVNETPSAEEKKAREDALWHWYLEWSEIARTVIHDYRLLRLLGFRSPSSTRRDEDDDQDEASLADEARDDGETSNADEADGQVQVAAPRTGGAATAEGRTPTAS